ncbi:low molecular weight protein-tyrosine-phosphatase [uncultured Microbacterium sp.]|uniref:low molecular weight protein-tyrosine-phosphatase n=1 Tax=uncultured Microbacterium sp. TaxID=191216 RepID=UPI0025F16EFD|nr:low molecular weight protein-tyrosine-phosphatase [uncultured Microbacterium sp.]
MPLADSAYGVVFVCSGNICRSPMAEVVLRALASDAGLGDRVRVTSAGTGDWHVGEHADPRTVAALARRGFDGSAHRARHYDAASFDRNDLVIALDRGHERALTRLARTDDDRDKIALLQSFAGAGADLDVPDPYYGDDALFDRVLTMIMDATAALFRQLEPALRRAPR